MHRGKTKPFKKKKREKKVGTRFLNRSERKKKEEPEKVFQNGEKKTCLPGVTRKKRISWSKSY